MGLFKETLKKFDNEPGGCQGITVFSYFFWDKCIATSENTEKTMSSLAKMQRKVSGKSAGSYWNTDGIPTTRPSKTISQTYIFVM